MFEFLDEGFRIVLSPTKKPSRQNTPCLLIWSGLRMRVALRTFQHPQHIFSPTAHSIHNVLQIQTRLGVGLATPSCKNLLVRKSTTITPAKLYFTKESHGSKKGEIVLRVR